MILCVEHTAYRCSFYWGKIVFEVVAAVVELCRAVITYSAQQNWSIVTNMTPRYSQVSNCPSLQKGCCLIGSPGQSQCWCQSIILIMKTTNYKRIFLFIYGCDYLSWLFRLVVYLGFGDECGTSLYFCNCAVVINQTCWQTLLVEDNDVFPFACFQVRSLFVGLFMAVYSQLFPVSK